MDKNIQKFLETEFKSKASIIDKKTVEVIAPDGESFYLICQTGSYISEETRRYELHVIEYIFDKNYSENKEYITQNIWRDLIINGVTFLGISPSARQVERNRIGQRIRQIREKRGMEARDLAKLAGIDAANLSRIEQGKYSVGIDILSKLSTALGMKIDFVEF